MNIGIISQFSLQVCSIFCRIRIFFWGWIRLLPGGVLPDGRAWLMLLAKAGLPTSSHDDLAMLVRDLGNKKVVFEGGKFWEEGV